ncbi:MAG: ABC transporter permease [Myxococcales bacterium]|nr:ABC transporter permease [Myxococcales bacterium]
MSVQLGVERPSAPQSSRLSDRVRFRWQGWWADPNPLWMREMRQSARLVRTPVILLLLTLLLTLLMASIGGLLVGATRPSSTGAALFHTFFSLAYFVVMIVGPALAANSIASEREGKTWESLLLTGLRPEAIARGKFLSAYTAIGMYIVMLAPVGALSFLFGGVGPLEVLLAYLMLFVLAVLGVAFGLAVSAKMESLRAALVTTLLVAMPLTSFSFGIFGAGFAQFANSLWPTVDRYPVWYPTALVRAPFDWRYLVGLILTPAALLGLPAWLLYEITKANLTSVTDDRTFGLKRWYIVTAAVLITLPSVAIVVGDRSMISEFTIAAMSLYSMFVNFGVLLFAFEEIGPSRRVQKALAARGSTRRAFAPGVLAALRLQLIVSALGLFAIAAIGAVTLQAVAPSNADEQLKQVLLFLGFAAGFALFLVGLGAFLRARATAAVGPRVALLAIQFLLFAAPWVLAAITGVFTNGDRSAIAIAAPSPLFVLLVGLPALRAEPALVLATVATASIYTVLGGVFAFMARRRCRAIIAAHEQLLCEADRRLAAEDAEAALRRAARDAHERESAEQIEAAVDAAVD